MKKNIDLGTTLYDANKQIMDQAGKELNHLEIAAKQGQLEDWFNMSIDCYAMLLCNERRDFTVFHLYENQNPNPPAVAAKECIGCLTDRGCSNRVLKKGLVWNNQLLTLILLS